MVGCFPVHVRDGCSLSASQAASPAPCAAAQHAGRGLHANGHKLSVTHQHESGLKGDTRDVD
jgi:hypothetical protein